MADPLRVLTEPYERICANIGCDHRIGMTLHQKIKAAVLAYVRVAFLMVCCGIIGACVTLRLHAQPTIGERAAILETARGLLETRMGIVEHDLAHTESEVSTIQGVGIGLGGLLAFLQLIQMIIGRQK